MKKLSDEDFDLQRNKIIGLGESSTRKSYYPELQKQIKQLDKKNSELLREIEERKQIQNALLESEKLYRTLTESMKEGVVITQKGKLVYSNPAFKSLLKIGTKDLNQLRVRDFIHVSYQKKYQDFIKAFEKGNADDKFTGLCIRGDGRDVWIQGFYQAIEWQGKKARLVTIRDVTEQKDRERVTFQEASKLQTENQLLKSRNMHRYGLGHLVGTSDKMQEVYENIIKAASINENIVVYGESGTGKELVSKSIHSLSKRREKPYVTVNCGAIPENLFESEFFGHKKGAFSGANTDKIGFFESADRGTLFLDEIGEVPLNLQVKLLRAIEGGYIPIGSTKTKISDVRIIAATNQDLKSLSEQGVVRQDFFFRIHIIPIYLPPLRDRKEDIPLLIYHFIKKMSAPDLKPPPIPDAIMEKFQSYDWPGNVRELQNAVSRYLAFKTTEFLDEKTGLKARNRRIDDRLEKGLNPLVTSYETRIIKKALEESCGNISKAAQRLKIGRRSLQRKITRLKINSR